MFLPSYDPEPNFTTMIPAIFAMQLYFFGSPATQDSEYTYPIPSSIFRCEGIY
jgi:hypothetical protein